MVCARPLADGLSGVLWLLFAISFSIDQMSANTAIKSSDQNPAMVIAGTHRLVPKAMPAKQKKTACDTMTNAIVTRTTACPV